MSSDQTITLRDLVDQLTREHRTPVYQHGRLLRYRTDPPLLNALRDARTGNIGNAAGGSGNAAHERSTLNIEASELFSSIQTRVVAWAKTADVPRHWTFAASQPINWTDPTELLRAWHTRIQSDAHFDERPFDSTLRAWTRSITDLCIDPPRRWVLAAPCPLCEARWVITADGIGPIGIDQHERRLKYPWAIAEGQQVDALSVTERDPVGDSIVVCRNCEAIWKGIEGPDGARQLAIAMDDAARIAS